MLCFFFTMMKAISLINNSYFDLQAAITPSSLLLTMGGCADELGIENQRRGQSHACEKMDDFFSLYFVLCTLYFVDIHLQST